MLTDAEKQELTALVSRGEVPRAFLWTLLGLAGLGVFMFLYALTEILPWD